MELREGKLVELRLRNELFSAHVPLEHISPSERAWFSKLAIAGDERSIALLIEAVEGVLIVDDNASAMRKRGESPA
jgi:hypothetical protein